MTAETNNMKNCYCIQNEYFPRYMVSCIQQYSYLQTVASNVIGSNVSDYTDSCYPGKCKDKDAITIYGSEWVVHNAEPAGGGLGNYIGQLSHKDGGGDTQYYFTISSDGSNITNVTAFKSTTDDQPSGDIWFSLNPGQIWSNIVNQSSGSINSQDSAYQAQYIVSVFAQQAANQNYLKINGNAANFNFCDPLPS